MIVRKYFSSELGQEAQTPLKMCDESQTVSAATIESVITSTSMLAPIIAPPDRMSCDSYDHITLDWSQVHH